MILICISLLKTTFDSGCWEQINECVKGPGVLAEARVSEILSLVSSSVIVSYKPGISRYAKCPKAGASTTPNHSVLPTALCLNR